MRQAIFHRAVREVLRGFPPEVKRSLVKAVWELQQGVRLGMPLSKAMPAVLAGVDELRVKDSTGTYRVFYYTRSKRGILVFHAFSKRSQRTPASEIVLGRRRLKELLDEET